LNKENTVPKNAPAAVLQQAKALFDKKKVFAQKLSAKKELLKSLDSSQSPVSEYL